LVSDGKCSKLMLTRVNSAALEAPSHYVAEIVRWMEILLQSQHNLSVQVNECVCDFIKDDLGQWHFINLKGYKITTESEARLKIWYSLNDSTSNYQHQLTKQERFLKHEAELGIQCKLCGLYFIENATIRIGKNQDGNSKSSRHEVPAFGYSLTAIAGSIVAGIYRSSNMPLTRLALYLLNNLSTQRNVHFRSVKRSTESITFDEGFQINKSDFPHKMSNNSELIVCCYNCCAIYERHVSLDERSRSLYELLGLEKKRNNVGFDAISSRQNTDRLFSSSSGQKTFPFVQPAYLKTEIKKKEVLRKFENFLRESQSAKKGAAEDYCTFHALPRNISHWRLVVMLHCLVLEDPEKIKELKTFFRDSPESTLEFCFSYRIGRNEMLIPLSIDQSCLGEGLMKNYSSKMKKITSEETHAINVKECRIHHLLGAKDDVFNYTKQKKLEFSLLGMHEKKIRSKHFAKKSFRTNTDYKLQEHNNCPLRTSFIKGFDSGIGFGSEQSAPQHQDILKEGDFEISLQEMRYYEADRGLSEGFAKFDVLIKLNARQLSCISIRFSIALNLDKEIPSNLMHVNSFLVEKKVLYWPEKDFFSMQSPLPSTWLSMLVNSADPEKKSVSGTIQVPQTDVNKFAVCEKRAIVVDNRHSETQQIIQNEVQEADRSSNSDILLPEEKRMKKSFLVDRFTDKFSLNYRLFDPHLQEKELFLSRPRKMSQLTIAQRASPNSLVGENETTHNKQSVIQMIPHEIAAHQKIRQFSSFFSKEDGSRRSSQNATYLPETVQESTTSNPGETRRPFSSQGFSESFLRTIKILEEFFHDQEEYYQYFLQHNGGEQQFYRKENHSVQMNTTTGRNSHIALGDDEDCDDEENHILKSNFIVQKLVFMLKGMKADFFDEIENADQKDEFPPALCVLPSSNSKKNISGQSTEFKRHKRTGTSLRSDHSQKKIIFEKLRGDSNLLPQPSEERKRGSWETEDVEICDDEEIDENSSLDSDMNYITGDVLSFMIGTLKYILVLDFLPSRIRWITLKSLIVEYYPMFCKKTA
jgi:hypothetical protein